MKGAACKTINREEVLREMEKFCRMAKSVMSQEYHDLPIQRRSIEFSIGKGSDL